METNSLHQRIETNRIITTGFELKPSCKHVRVRSRLQKNFRSSTINCWFAKHLERVIKSGLLDNASNFWLMHLFEYPKMYVAQNALRAQTCMWQYWKKHFLTEKYPKLEKKHVRQAACQAAGRPESGRRLGRLYFILESINKVRVLEGDCQSSFTLKNNPKLTKNHVRRPVSRRASGCAPIIVALDSSKPLGPCALLAWMSLFIHLRAIRGFWIQWAHPLES